MGIKVGSIYGIYITFYEKLTDNPNQHELWKYKDPQDICDSYFQESLVTTIEISLGQNFHLKLIIGTSGRQSYNLLHLTPFFSW